MTSSHRAKSDYSAFSLHLGGHHRDLHSFPTRRSSDLSRVTHQRDFRALLHGHHQFRRARQFVVLVRSEEHTSELQSLTNLVCRLLLEKKNRYCHHQSRGPHASSTDERRSASSNYYRSY